MLRRKRFLFIVVMGLLFLGLMTPPAAAAPKSKLTPEQLRQHIQQSIEELPPEAQQYFSGAAAACPPGGENNVVFTTPIDNSTQYVIEQCFTQCQLIEGNTLNGDEICLKIFGVPENSTFDGSQIPTDGSDVKCDPNGNFSGTFCFRPDHNQAGNFTVLFVLTDKVTSCSQIRFVTFNVSCETEEPAITCPPDSTVAADANCQAIVPDFSGGVTVSDNCTPDQFLNLSQSPSAGTVVGPGVHPVTITATDACGNVGSCRTTFTALDQISPEILCPANISVQTDSGHCDGEEVYFITTGSDNCSEITISCNPQSGSLFPVGVTTITCSASDSSGNQATCQFSMNVFVLKGDMDGNGLLTPPDPVLSLNCIFLGIGTCDLCFADMNCDGLLTAPDLVLVIRAVFLGQQPTCQQ